MAEKRKRLGKRRSRRRIGNCTWKNCQNKATYRLKNKLDVTWAKLCSFHNSEFNLAMSSESAKVAVCAWSLAGYGLRRW